MARRNGFSRRILNDGEEIDSDAPGRIDDRLRNDKLEKIAEQKSKRSSNFRVVCVIMS